MVFSEEDEILIKNLYVYKGYSARQLIDDFPGKGWKLRSLNYLLKKKLRETDSTDRKKKNISLVRQTSGQKNGAFFLPHSVLLLLLLLHSLFNALLWQQNKVN